MPAKGVWADSLKGPVADRLRKLGVRRVLVQMAEREQLLALKCEMPTCYSPYGRRRFQYRPKTTPFPKWAPNADHYPKLKGDGGHLDRWNVRLAHVYCNAVDSELRRLIRRMLRNDEWLTYEQIAEALNDAHIQSPHGTNTWSATTARKAYVS